MTAQEVHATLAAKRWLTLSLADQYANWQSDETLDHLPPPPMPSSITSQQELEEFIASQMP